MRRLSRGARPKRQGQPWAALVGRQKKRLRSAAAGGARGAQQRNGHEQQAGGFRHRAGAIAVAGHVVQQAGERNAAGVLVPDAEAGDVLDTPLAGETETVAAADVLQRDDVADQRTVKPEEGQEDLAPAEPP
jgi:hypothetical protein